MWIANTSAFQSVCASPSDAYNDRHPPCDSLPRPSEEYWVCRLRHYMGSLYYPVSTCKMGDTSDDTAVAVYDSSGLLFRFARFDIDWLIVEFFKQRHGLRWLFIHRIGLCSGVTAKLTPMSQLMWLAHSCHNSCVFFKLYIEQWLRCEAENRLRSSNHNTNNLLLLVHLFKRIPC